MARNFPSELAEAQAGTKEGWISDNYTRRLLQKAKHRGYA